MSPMIKFIEHMALKQLAWRVAPLDSAHFRAWLAALPEALVMERGGEWLVNEYLEHIYEKI